MEQKSPNLYQRLNAVQQKIKYVKKDAEIKSGGVYKGVTHDQVVSVVRPEMVKHGILHLPHLISSTMIDTGRVTSKGTPMFRYEATYDVRFQNMDDRDDFHDVRVEAHAEDTGDKAPGKAISYAVKYATLKVLQLETGENDESREDSRPKPISDSQLLDLHKMCERFQWDANDTLERIARSVYKLKRIEDLPMEHFGDVVQMMNNRFEKEGQGV